MVEKKKNNRVKYTIIYSIKYGKPPEFISTLLDNLLHIAHYTAGAENTPRRQLLVL